MLMIMQVHKMRDRVLQVGETDHAMEWTNSVAGSPLHRHHLTLT